MFKFLKRKKDQQGASCLASFHSLRNEVVNLQFQYDVLSSALLQAINEIEKIQSLNGHKAKKPVVKKEYKKNRVNNSK